jgi:error-prone DNA polymerase
VNASHWDCTLEPTGDATLAMRLGWRMLRGIKRVSVDRIESARQVQPFRSQEDFAWRTGLGQGELTLLARADAFQSLEPSRRKSHWDALPSREPTPLFAGVDHEQMRPALPEMTAVQETTADYQAIGLSLRAHPMSFLRADLDRLGIVSTASLATVEPDRKYRIAGLVLLRQRPSTAKGITFMTIEDETGTANLVIHVNVWERFRKVARSASAIIAHGILQRQDDIIHLVIDRLEDLTHRLAAIGNRSRDFH